MEQARRLAHTVKGVAGTIGALHLQSLAVQLQASLLFPANFAEELAVVIDSIGQLLAMNPAKNVLPAFPKSVVDPGVLLQTLTLLERPLQKRRPKRCEPILNKLTHMAFPAGMEGDMNNVVGLIRVYRMKEAIPILHVMVRQLKKILDPKALDPKALEHESLDNL